jgi:CDP-paratose synthetase
MSTVLLTGGTGYLGSKMAGALLGAGHRVVVLKRPSSPLARLEGLPVELRDDLPAGADAVVHCATDYGGLEEANVRLPRRAASVPGARVFLNVDTALPPEVSAYARTKAEFRRWLERSDRPPVRVNAAVEHFYGPGDAPSKFVSHVIGRLLARVEQLDLTAGEQERDFIHVDDVVTALVTLLGWSFQAPEGLHHFGVGSGAPVSIRALVERIRDLTGNEATRLAFGILPYRPGEVMKSRADTAALVGLGWRPRVPLEEGLRRTIEEERSRLKP